MIILEGPDLAGKTTLANRLHSSLGWPILKDEPLGSVCYNQIWDRHWPSEWVYHTHGGEEHAKHCLYLSRSNIESINYYIRKYNGIIVFVIPTIDEIIERFCMRKEPYRLSRLLNIRQAYIDLASDNKMFDGVPHIVTSDFDTIMRIRNIVNNDNY